MWDLLMDRKNKKNKNITICAALTAALVFLGGCGNAIPDMSTEVEQKVGEYAGFVMLRYDANHRSRLVDLPEESFPEETVEEPETPVEEIQEEVQEEQQEIQEEVVNPVEVIDNTTEQETETVTPEEFLGLAEGMSLIYQGFSFEDSYSGQMDDFLSVDASEGKKLLVLYFTLYNQTGTAQDVDFLGDGAAFKAVINGNVTRTALLSMLMSDMAAYKGTIENGYGEELALIFEEDENIVPESIQLVIQNTGGKCTVTLE